MLSRLKFEIDALINEILDNIPERIWVSKTTTFFDPCMAGGQFIKCVIDRLYKYGHTKNNIEKRIFGCGEHKNDVQYAIRKNKLIGEFWPGNPLEEEYDMKFDCVLGNLPFQDGKQNGGQNKIYNQLSKIALGIITSDGVVALITPTSVLKKSKRFSLIGQEGLKSVDFTSDDHFNVGVNICSWIVDKQHVGDVNIIHSNGEDTQSNDKVIYNYSEIDKDFAILYEALKEVMDKPEKRMFKQNNFGPAMAKTKSKEYSAPLYKLVNGKESEITFYSKRTPYYVNKKKFIISMTKGFNENATTISTDDFDVAHLCIGIKNVTEANNIKSFIFSDYFKQHSEDWKRADGYGYNYALKYLPPFDKNKKWNNKSVEKFLKSFIK